MEKPTAPYITVQILILVLSSAITGIFGFYLHGWVTRDKIGIEELRMTRERASPTINDEIQKIIGSPLFAKFAQENGLTHVAIERNNLGEVLITEDNQARLKQVFRRYEEFLNGQETEDHENLNSLSNQDRPEVIWKIMSERTQRSNVFGWPPPHTESDPSKLTPLLVSEIKARQQSVAAERIYLKKINEVLANELQFNGRFQLHVTLINYGATDGMIRDNAKVVFITEDSTSDELPLKIATPKDNYKSFSTLGFQGAGGGLAISDVAFPPGQVVPKGGISRLAFEPPEEVIRRKLDFFKGAFEDKLPLTIKIKLENINGKKVSYSTLYTKY